MKPTWMVVIGLIAAASSCPDCCTVHVVLEASTEQSPVDPCSCNITIDDLCQPDWYDNSTISCPQREFVFQSGIHQSTSSSLLLFISNDKVIIRGEPNATIRCWDDFFLLDFQHTPNIIIKDIQVWNCLCTFCGIYTGDVTTTGPSHQMGPIVVEIEIINSEFINSRLVYYLYYKMAQSMNATIIIKDSIVTNCSDSHQFLNILMKDNPIIFPGVMLRMTLENSNFTDNNSPLLAPYKLRGKFFFCIFITFTGHNNFARNKASIIEIPDTLDYKPNSTCKQTILFSTAEVHIKNNINVNYSPSHPAIRPLNSRALIFAINANIIFKHCHAIFSDNYGGAGGGIVITGDSEIVFEDSVSVEFNNNTGVVGGPLYLESSSTMIFNATKSNIVLKFNNNSAQRGGAIYIADNAKYIKSIFDLQCSAALVTLTFCNNKAVFGGNQIFGGWVDWFRDQDGVIRYESDIMKEILKFDNSSDSEVSSCAIRICLCKDGRPDCNITNTTMEIYGYAVSLDLVAVGQRFTPVAGTIEANLSSSESKQMNEMWQQLWLKTDKIESTCTSITYKILSNQADILYLLPLFDDCNDGFGANLESQMPKYAINDSVTAQAMLLFQQVSIHLKYQNCPIGFYLHKSNRNCVCQPSLLNLGLSCDLKSIKIHRNKHQWVGMAHEHTITSSENQGVIVYPYCPFDYCRTDNESLLIRLEDESELCAFNRSGILCGGCGTNYSRVLGSSRCKVCSMNFQMFAIILGWLLFGLMLVIILMLLDLTVSAGTINGLTFYANIIQAQRATFFTTDVSSPFLSKFIAWLNLDQGFETCLYNGLDEYSITWLQFLFPLYMWLIATALIVTSRYSTRISKLIGSNAVQVLATLFLLSYVKLLQLIIEVFSFTTLTYPNGYKKTVWLVDGNIEFLKGKHIPLFLVTVVFVLFSLPYTLILLTVQFLYKISHYSMMFWIQKLKPLFDAYTGPYRDNHRYWTGLLLNARVVLLVVFTLNERDDTSINLFVIILISFVLVVWLGLSRLVYKHPLNNFLEVVFLLNLGMTSIAVFFDKGTAVAIEISTILALIKVVGIIIYHAQKKLLLTELGSEFKLQASNYIISKLNEVANFGHKVRQFISCCKWRWKPPTIQPVEPLLIEAEPEQQGTY